MVFHRFISGGMSSSSPSFIRRGGRESISSPEEWTVLPPSEMVNVEQVGLAVWKVFSVARADPAHGQGRRCVETDPATARGAVFAPGAPATSSVTIIGGFVRQCRHETDDLGDLGSLWRMKRYRKTPRHRTGEMNRRRAGDSRERHPKPIWRGPAIRTRFQRSRS